MNNKLELAFIIIALFVILYMLLPKSGEKFNSTYYGSSLEKDMDYIKDNKGRTLDDYILYNHAVHGTGIDSPF